MANYYIKKIESTNEATTVNSLTNGVDGSILKTNSQVGIFNKRGNNFYINGSLNTSQGKVFNQTGTNYMPRRSNLSNLIQNTNVKAVFNKFFSNSTTTDETHAVSNPSSMNTNWSSATNLNAFAYMKSNGVEGKKF
jgi:hypothetical protein